MVARLEGLLLAGLDGMTADIHSVTVQLLRARTARTKAGTVGTKPAKTNESRQSINTKHAAHLFYPKADYVPADYLSE